MASQEVVQRTPLEDLVAQIRSDEFQAQLALALPENVTKQRYTRVAITACQANASVAELERPSVHRALLQSAAMGLLPDGREAAIVPFKGKAQLIPMIAGFRKIAAEYGWTIYTAIAYENDEFEYEQGLDVAFRHRPVRPGRERGDVIAAYAVGKHQDGRRELEVLTVEEIEKVRATSQTATREDAPWTQWWEQMAEKTAGKRLFKKLPLSEDDRRVRIIRAAVEPIEAAAALYGPNARSALQPGETLDRETGEITAQAAAPDGGGYSAVAPADQQAEGASLEHDSSSRAPSAPDLDSEPQLALGNGDNEVIEKAGRSRIPKGDARGLTLAEVLAEEKAADWFGWALTREDGYWSGSFREKLKTFARAKLPDVWREYELRQER